MICQSSSVDRVPGYMVKQTLYHTQYVPVSRTEASGKLNHCKQNTEIGSHIRFFFLFCFVFHVYLIGNLPFSLATLYNTRFCNYVPTGDFIQRSILMVLYGRIIHYASIVMSCNTFDHAEWAQVPCTYFLPLFGSLIEAVKWAYEIMNCSSLSVLLLSLTFVDCSPGDAACLGNVIFHKLMDICRVEVWQKFSHRDLYIYLVAIYMWQFHIGCTGTLDELAGSHTRLAIYPALAIHYQRVVIHALLDTRFKGRQ